VSGKLLFVHGTGVRDVSPTMAKIRPQVEKFLGWPGSDVVPVQWGLTVGPPELDITAALPPDDGGRGATVDPGPETPGDGSLWDLLVVDARIELAALAAADQDEPDILDPAADPVGPTFVRRVRAISLDIQDLARAGVTADQVTEAATDLAADPTLERAAVAATGTEHDLLGATARALVAAIVADQIAKLDADEPPPAVVGDPAARDDLVAAIVEALGGRRDGDRGLVWDKLVGPLATRVGMAKRSAFMSPFSDFTRDVLWYLAHGEHIRDEIAKAARAASGSEPLVILGHSLGGIAAVDLLSSPEATTGDQKLVVDQLVTVGSQAPLLYLLTSLHTLSPGEPDSSPFTPWLNIYNRHDLLSFCAERVFSRASPIIDAEVDVDVPFPASHSAYWDQDLTFELIRDNLPK
jgi:hypothetical protein